jgi:GNAT superfamily N-acetyltransferase
MSLYSEYVKELECGRDIIEIDKVAFVTYFIHTDTKECYIEDMYIRPRYRNGGLCFKILKNVEDIAKKKGCTELTHGIVKAHKDHKTIKLISEKYGFRFVHETETEVYFAKEIL